MKKLSVALLTFAFVLVAHAQTSTVTYPIAELGGCTSQSDCRTYCNDLSHIEACLTYGEQHGLMKSGDVARARQAIAQLKNFASGGTLGAGTTTGTSTSDRDKERENKIFGVLKAGPGPGGCKTKDACRIYCAVDAHVDECLAFAKAHAIMDKDEYNRAREFVDRVHLEHGSTTGSTTPPFRRDGGDRDEGDRGPHPVGSTTPKVLTPDQVRALTPEQRAMYFRYLQNEQGGDHQVGPNDLPRPTGTGDQKLPPPPLPTTTNTGSGDHNGASAFDAVLRFFHLK